MMRGSAWQKPLCLITIGNMALVHNLPLIFLFFYLGFVLNKVAKHCLIRLALPL